MDWKIIDNYGRSGGWFSSKAVALNAAAGMHGYRVISAADGIVRVTDAKPMEAFRLAIRAAHGPLSTDY